MVPGQSGDLEQNLLDSMDGDQRLASGTHAPPADNVLDFVRMSGLAGQQRPRQRAVTQPTRRDAVLDPLIFFEQGVGDVDTAMDPVLPILRDTSPIETDHEPIVPDETDSAAIGGLMEIISELRQRDTGGTDSDISDEVAAVEALTTTTEQAPPRIDESLTEIVDWLDDSAGDQTAQTPPQSEPAIVYELERNSLVPGAPAAPDYPEAPSDDTPTTSPRDLEEARALLEELEETGPLAPQVAAAPAFDPRPTVQPSEIPAAARASNRRPHHRKRRKLGRWVARGLLVLVLLGISAGVILFFLAQAETPAAAYRSAERQLSRGDYAAASVAFQNFARRFPSDIEASDALFLAGYALQLAPTTPRARSRQAHAEALALLEQFIVEYPSHPKAARAETLMGVLFYRMDQPAEAISILRDPDRRLRDPGAHLTTLRTLGRSYAALSEIENAHGAFMQAAALEENLAADQDYVELGALYQTLAERSTSESAKHAYWTRAVEQWDFALRVPGLLKSRRDDIRLMRDLVANKLDQDRVSARLNPSMTESR